MRLHLVQFLSGLKECVEWYRLSPDSFIVRIPSIRLYHRIPGHDRAILVTSENHTVEGAPACHSCTLTGKNNGLKRNVRDLSSMILRLKRTLRSCAAHSHSHTLLGICGHGKHIEHSRISHASISQNQRALIAERVFHATHRRLELPGENELTSTRIPQLGRVIRRARE